MTISHSAEIENGGFDIVMPAGYRAVITGLPGGTAYSVTEDSGRGWNLMDAENTSGFVRPVSVTEAQLSNQYSVTSASALLVATKTLDGFSVTSEAYVFEIVEDGVVVATSMDVVAGVVRFDPILYDEAGVHNYVIREVGYGSDTVDYDARQWRVVVSVVDDDGVLSANVTYPEGVPEFGNVTRPGQLLLQKLVESSGVSGANGDFDFVIRLRNENGMPVNSVTMRRMTLIE